MRTRASQLPAPSVALAAGADARAEKAAGLKLGSPAISTSYETAWATFDQEILATLERLWSSSAPVGSDAAAGDVHRAVKGSASRCPACHVGLPLSSHGSTDLARHVFMVNTRDFMDPWTFNVKNVMKCCVEFLVPDGRMIPFCAYNSVGYREQVARELMNDPTTDD